MFKLLVVLSLAGIAFARPGLVGTVSYSAVAPVAYASPVAIPAAVSSTFRKDIHSSPIVAYSAPVVAAPVLHNSIVAPAAYLAAPLTYAAHVPAIHTYL